MYKKISIIGAGTWGVAIANHLSSKVSVELTHYREDFLKKIKNTRRHPRLPNFLISESVKIKYNLNPKADLHIIATPVQHIRDVLKQINISDKNPILILSKGVEKKTLMFPVNVVEDTLKRKDGDFAILSGPSHAEEVLRKTPTSVVVSSRSDRTGKALQELFSNKYFRVYSNKDMTGVQLGGAVKNVIAIAAGIVSGLGYGDNTISALLTRGIYEIKFLGLSLGAKKETLNGLAGLGDLMTTSFSKHSRNRYVGERLGKGEKLKDILSELKMSAEGVDTSQSLYFLSKEIGVSLPICEKVYQILYFNKEPRRSIEQLMSRDLRDEF